MNTKIETRIAKLCWNENYWRFPSGTVGKSNDAKSFERRYGYGHEEWIFDYSKTIKGYHHSYLQSVQKFYGAYAGRVFDIYFWAHDSSRGKSVWIGKIKNVHVISEEEAEAAYAIYRRNGWNIEMMNQIEAVNADSKRFRRYESNPIFIFNISFRPENATVFSDRYPVENFQQAIGTYRQQLVKAKRNFRIETASEEERRFSFDPGKKKKFLTRRLATRVKKRILIDPLHDKIQDELFDTLAEEYGEEKVGWENNTGLDTHIDITLRRGNRYALYEIKSYPSVRISLREAMGQLFEYAFYPKAIDVDELIIVSAADAKPNDLKYLQHLRAVTGLKIFYQKYDLNRKKLLEKQ